MCFPKNFVDFITTPILQNTDRLLLPKYLLKIKKQHQMNFQKQSFADILQNRCSLKFCINHKKTAVLESVIADFQLNKLYHVIFQSFFCIHLFPMFFMVQVLQGLGFLGSESRVWVQVLEVAQLQCLQKKCENKSKVHKIQKYITIIKAWVPYFLRNFYSLSNDSPSKTMKDVFYFI